MTQILAQVQVAGIRFLHIIVVHIKLFSVVVELDQNFPGLYLNATIRLVKFDCSAKSTAMDHPNFLIFSVLPIGLCMAVFIGFRLERGRKISFVFSFLA